MKDWVIATNHTEEIRLVLRHIDREIFLFGPWISTQLMPFHDNRQSRILVGDKEEMETFLEALIKEKKIESGEVIFLPQFYPDLYQSCRRLEISEGKPY